MGSTTVYPEDLSSTAGLPDEYDFIVIGGGTAGLTLASRLSENPSLRVLVLEAGDSKLQDPNIMIPGLAASLTGNPEYDWNFVTVPQKELNGRQVALPRGKVLGGSSAIYRLKHVFSSTLAFDIWEKWGNPGWTYEAMKPYLLKFHTFTPPSKDYPDLKDIAFKDEALESNEGPIQIAYSGWSSAEKDWYETWKQIMAEDFKYKGDALGGFAHPAAIDPKTRTRSYAVTAYYPPEVAARSNFRVVTGASVEKIVLQKGSEVVASGVQFLSKSGERIVVHAKKEVIVSAGALQSPQILELSGIGSKSLLEKFGIETVVDNPNVGEHLQDHPLVGIAFEAADGVETADDLLRDPSQFGPLMAMYQKDQSGVMGEASYTSANVPHPEFYAAAGHEKLAKLLAELSPDTQKKTPYDKLKDKTLLHLLSQDDSASIDYFMVKIQFDIENNVDIVDIAAPKHPGNYISILTSMHHEFSRGHVHINSASVKDKPTVDMQYLSHPMDIEIFARHVQYLSKILTTPPFSKLFKPNGRRIPIDAFPNGTEPPSLEKAKELSRRCLMSNLHPAGSCAMGKKENGGVVDERLRVHGVKGLRVVDASIFPCEPRGNPCSLVYAIAERAVDFIKEDHAIA